MILRIGVSTFLIHDSFVRLASANGFQQAVTPSIVALLGVLLFTGLWTPIAGALGALVELWIAFSERGEPWSYVLAAAIASGLALLGPGAWSIDALAFGRKKISIQDR
jgi:hypothetical protein